MLGGTQHGFGEGIVRVYIFDIQNQKDRQAGMAATAYPIGGDWDELTGLRRKRAFFAAGDALVKRQRGDWRVLALDIEHFRLFNAAAYFHHMVKSFAAFRVCRPFGSRKH